MSRIRQTPFLYLTSLLALASIEGIAQVNVLTANGNNDRSNANLQESQLTPAGVLPGSFGKLGSFPVDGQVYSQPLYVSAFPMSGAGTRNVLIVSTMHNSVYAYDADSAAAPNLLWQVTLGPAVPASMLFTKYSDIWPEVGILSTGVIDRDRGVLYIVAETLKDAAPAFYLHALDLSTGVERMNGPVAIAAAAADVQFDPQQHMQRPGLLLANGAIYVTFGSHADQSPWHGWLVSYAASDLTRQLGVFLTTPSGEGGAIWQSGRGLAADEIGNVYFMTGNGSYDGKQNLAESFVKVSGAAALKSGVFTPANWQSLTDNDADLSTGVALLPGSHLMLGGDKSGQFYIVDGDSLEASVTPNVTGGLFNFAVWNQSGHSYLYTQGWGDAVKRFEIRAGKLNSTPLSAGPAARNARVGMTISANGDQAGILWETTEDPNDHTAGVLHAFDASNLANELWNSNANQAQDGLGAFAKFVNPTVANGTVYVATFSGVVVAYGQLVGQASACCGL